MLGWYKALKNLEHNPELLEVAKSFIQFNNLKSGGEKKSMIIFTTLRRKKNINLLSVPYEHLFKYTWTY